MTYLTFDDFQAGDVLELSPYTVEEAEMLAFARQYDPQSFHTDAVAAKDSPYGGIIGSGWLTTAIFMRMQSDAFIVNSSSVGSPGVDEIRWLLPVRPGDTLSGVNEVVEVKPSRSKPDRGVVFSNVTINNQHGDTVMTLVTRVIYLKRT